MCESTSGPASSIRVYVCIRYWGRQTASENTAKTMTRTQIHNVIGHKCTPFRKQHKSLAQCGNFSNSENKQKINVMLRIE